MQISAIVACLVAGTVLCQGAPSRWGSWGGSADSEGRSLGGYTNVETRSDVRNDGWGSRASSSGSGSANGVGRTAVDLRSRAGVNGREGRSRAGANAWGNRASSSAGANAVDASNYGVSVGASGAGSSVSTRGDGGAGSWAEAADNYSSVSMRGEGRGRGDLVVSGSQSDVGLHNSRGVGKTNSFSRASGRRFSSTSTGARYHRQG